MRKMLIIAAREYRAAVRTKSFVVSLVIMPLLMCGGAIIQGISKRLEDTGEKRFAIIDRTPGQHLFMALDAAARKRNETDIFDQETGQQNKPLFILERIEPSADSPEQMREQRWELSQRVHRGEIFGFLEIGCDVATYSPELPTGAGLGPPPKPSDRIVLRYQSNNPTHGMFYRWAEKVVNAAVHAQRCIDLGITPEKILALLQPIPILPKGLSKRNADTGAIEEPPTESEIVHLLLPAGLVGLMFMVVMVGAPPLMQSVLEEKIQRIAEVLLGSVQPFQLMMGKLIGMVGVSLTISAVYVTGVYAAIHYYGYAEYLPAHIVIWFLIFQPLAVVFYGSLFIAVGAACTEMKETQTLLMPVMFLACVPLFFLVQVIERPNSTFAFLLSLFPPATAMLMIARLSVPPGIPWWQPLLGVVVLLATTMVFVYAAGRIFRVGLLLQGKAPRVGELVKWVVRG